MLSIKRIPVTAKFSAWNFFPRTKLQGQQEARFLLLSNESRMSKKLKETFNTKSDIQMNHAQLFVTKANFAHQTAKYSINRMNTNINICQGTTLDFKRGSLQCHSHESNPADLPSASSYCFCVSTGKVQFIRAKMIACLHFQ